MPTMIAAALLAMTQSPATQEPPRAQEQPAATAADGFGLELYRALDRAQPGKNLFFSPYSVAVALTMTAEGARDETAAEMLQVLHLPSPIAPAHAAFAALAQRFRAGGGETSEDARRRIATLRQELDAANRQAEELERAGKGREARDAAQRAQKVADALNALLATVDCYDLRVANGLWVERTFQLVPDYVATIDRHYGTGGVAPLDFAGDPEGARQHINGWVEQHTERRIRDLLPAGSVTPGTRLVIGNAVFFRGEWAKPFEKASTRREDFVLAGGEPVKADLMRERRREQVPYAAFDGRGNYFATPLEVPQDEKLRPPTYPDDAGFTMIELPYKGGELTMTVLAPRSPGGLKHLEGMLTAPALANWLARLQPRTVDTAMLRFEQNAAFDLAAVLRGMGMRRAFVNPAGPAGAQFGGMSAATDPERQLFIGAVLHKAWVAVDEKGTEAAAATAVAMAPGSAAPRVTMVPFVPVFRADRPFLFLIRDARSGTVLFLGRVVDPRA